MAANDSGVQVLTLRSLALAWVLTLPCAIAEQKDGNILATVVPSDRRAETAALDPAGHRPTIGWRFSLPICDYPIGTMDATRLKGNMCPSGARIGIASRSPRS
jgi:hypothetical protein